MSKQKLRPVKMDEETWEMARFKSVYVLGKENRSEYIRRRIESDEDYKDTEYNINLRKAAPELFKALQIYLNAGCKNQRRDASIIAKKAIQKALGNDN